MGGSVVVDCVTMTVVVDGGRVMIEVVGGIVVTETEAVVGTVEGVVAGRELVSPGVDARNVISFCTHD